jgi:hypothetical protein
MNRKGQITSGASPKARRFYKKKKIKRELYVRHR